MSLPRTGIFLSTLVGDLRDLSVRDIEERYAASFLVVLGIADTPHSEDVPTVRNVANERDGNAVRQLPGAAPLLAPASLGELVVFPIRRRPTSMHDVVEIGRLDVNDIVIHHSSVAGFHAVLHRGSNGELNLIVDRRTTGGTFVDSERVPSDGEGVTLTSARQLRLGGVSLVYLDVRGLVDLAASLTRSRDGAAVS